MEKTNAVDLERARTHNQPEKMSTGRYFATRFTTLKPPLTKVVNTSTQLSHHQADLCL
jgi:hypothetical protein